MGRIKRLDASVLRPKVQKPFDIKKFIKSAEKVRKAVERDELREVAKRERSELVWVEFESFWSEYISSQRKSVKRLIGMVLSKLRIFTKEVMNKLKTLLGVTVFILILPFIWLYLYMYREAIEK